ncbi:MAG TPA: hypothetical protein V6C97_12660, partial [Oculatellaceae cyanobacterium]
QGWALIKNGSLTNGEPVALRFLPSRNPEREGQREMVYGEQVERDSWRMGVWYNSQTEGFESVSAMQTLLQAVAAFMRVYLSAADLETGDKAEKDVDKKAHCPCGKQAQCTCQLFGHSAWPQKKTNRLAKSQKSTRKS